MEKIHDEHYVRSVTRMGDSRNVFTNQTIFTSNRIKLVEKGVKINSSLFERLVSHKLIPKIDECLDVENGITPQGLRGDAQDLLDNDPSLAVLNDNPRQRNRMLRAFEGIPLVPPVAFKLTVASCQRPEVYDHSLRVALVALHLAMKSFFFSDKELSTLAAAAILHDIGVLHIPPELLRPGRRLEKSERHHLYAHPITGYLVLREYAEYHPEISRTVFEHHERLDGSGYPRGIRETDICPGAQILMLAEVASTVFERDSQSGNLAKLSVLLRLNHKKFNREVGSHLIGLVSLMQSGHPGDEEQSLAFATSATLKPKLTDLAHVFHDWKNIAIEKAGEMPFVQIATVIDERLAELRRTLLAAGFDMDQPEALFDAVSEDADALIELNVLLGETRWQLAEIIHEANRHMSELENKPTASDETASSVLDWIQRSETVLSQGKQAS